MPVGYYDFSPLIQSTQQNLQQKDYTSQNLVNLGGAIQQSLSAQNMRAEAAHAAPLLQQQYAQGFSQIQNGDVAGGLSQIYGAGAPYAGNPLISQYAQQAQQGAALVAHGVVQGQLLSGRLQSQMAIAGGHDATRIAVGWGNNQTSAQNNANNNATSVANNINTNTTSANNTDVTQQGLNARQQQALTQKANDLNAILTNKDSLQGEKEDAQIQLQLLKAQQASGISNPQEIVAKGLAVQKAYNTQMAALDKVKDQAASNSNLDAWGVAANNQLRLTDTTLQGAEQGIKPDGSPLASAKELQDINASRTMAQNALRDPNVSLEDKQSAIKNYMDKANPILDTATQNFKRTVALAPTLKKALDSYKPAQVAPQVGTQEGATATNPTTGVKYIYQGGNWNTVQ